MARMDDGKTQSKDEGSLVDQMNWTSAPAADAVDDGWWMAEWWFVVDDSVG